MSQTQTIYTYTDPRYFEGDPFEVAEKATRQAKAAIELSQRAVDDAETMARNAEMERDLYATDTCSAKDWPTGAQGRIFAAIKSVLGEQADRLGALVAAASYNPRKPPRE